MEKDLTVNSMRKKLYGNEKSYGRSEWVIYINSFPVEQCPMFKGWSRNLYENYGGNFLHLAGNITKYNNFMTEHVHRTEGSMWNIKYYLGNETQNRIDGQEV